MADTSTTTYPIPSSNVDVLDLNAKNIDTFSNGSESTYTDRGGVERNTLSGIQSNFEQALVDYGGLKNKGGWVATTSYKVNNLWQSTVDDTWYLVLQNYASGVSEQVDIDAGYVQVWQGYSKTEIDNEFYNKTESIAKVTSIENLSSYSFFEGGRVSVTGYHEGAAMGGGEFVVETARHDGGAAISLNRSFPTDWSDQSQLEDWFDDSGSDELCLVRVDNRAARLSDFGAKVDGVSVDRLPVQAACSWAKSNKTLYLDGGECQIGEVPDDGKWAVYIDSPENMVITGNITRFWTTTTKVRDSVFSVRNPNGFYVDGVRFSDVNFDVADIVGGGALRVGTYGFYVWADSNYTEENPCGDIKIDGEITDNLGFVIVSGELSALGGTDVALRNIKNVKVTGKATRAYYGMSSLYQCDGLKVNLLCEDVRRGCITYGQKKADIDVDLVCTAGFIGSNAFIELACEGETVNQNGVDYDGNVEDIDVRLRVSGVEAHEGLVSFYHQQDQVEGSISNVRAMVTCDNLTTIGKSPDLSASPEYIYRFFHELTNGSTLTPTTRQYMNIDIDCSITGSLSGGSYKIDAESDTKGLASVGAGVFTGAPSTGSNLLWSIFKVLTGTQFVKFTPIVYGETTFGSATYTIQKGVAEVVNGLCRFSISLTWSGHTGAGPIKVGSLPFKARDTDSVSPIVSVPTVGYGSSNFANLAFSQITGDLLTLTPYTISGGVVDLTILPPSGSLEIFGEYPLY